MSAAGAAGLGMTESPLARWHHDAAARPGRPAQRHSWPTGPGPARVGGCPGRSHCNGSGCAISGVFEDATVTQTRKRPAGPDIHHNPAPGAEPDSEPPGDRN